MSRRGSAPYSRTETLVHRKQSGVKKQMDLQHKASARSSHSLFLARLSALHGRNIFYVTRNAFFRILEAKRVRR